VPEPIRSAGSNMCVYDPSQDVSSAASAPTAEPIPPPGNPAGVTALVNKHPPPASGQCLSQKAAVAVASGNFVRAAGSVIVGAPTLAGDIPAILTFIGSAITLGATAAALANCQDDAAEKSKAK
jgi:hypothetical protein